MRAKGGEEERKQLEVTRVPPLVLQRSHVGLQQLLAGWDPAGQKQSKVDSPLVFFWSGFVSVV